MEKKTFVQKIVDNRKSIIKNVIIVGASVAGTILAAAFLYKPDAADGPLEHLDVHTDELTS